MQINSTLLNNQQQKVSNSQPHPTKIGNVRGSSDDKKYICCICNRAFQYDFTYEAHLNAHAVTTSKPECRTNSITTKFQASVEQQGPGVPLENIKKYVCNVCGKAFIYEFSLKVHFEAHAKTKSDYRCAKSSVKEATTPGRVTRRLVKKCAGNESYKCQICNQVFKDEFTYKVHLEAHVPRSVPNTVKSEIGEHQDNVLAHEQFFCRVNQDVTPQSDGIVHGVRKIIVEPCADPFREECQVKEEFDRKSRRKRPLKQATTSSTDNHLKSGFGSPDDCCVISFDSPRIKQQCLESVGFCADDVKPFTCMFCDSAFRWEISLTIHLKMHKEHT